MPKQVNRMKKLASWDRASTKNMSAQKLPRSTILSGGAPKTVTSLEKKKAMSGYPAPHTIALRTPIRVGQIMAGFSEYITYMQ